MRRRIGYPHNELGLRLPVKTEDRTHGTGNVLWPIAATGGAHAAAEGADSTDVWCEGRFLNTQMSVTMVTVRDECSPEIDGVPMALVDLLLNRLGDLDDLLLASRNPRSHRAGAVHDKANVNVHGRCVFLVHL